MCMIYLYFFVRIHLIVIVGFLCSSPKLPPLRLALVLYDISVSTMCIYRDYCVCHHKSIELVSIYTLDIMCAMRIQCGYNGSTNLCQYSYSDNRSADLHKRHVDMGAPDNHQC